MENTRFDTPVVLRSAQSGSDTSVASAREAMDFLLGGWTGKRGPRHRKALQACHDALAGHKTAIGARRDFVAAAREAGVLVTNKPFT